ncbi:MAG: diadenylate cyclase CdaA [Acidobacteriota bacterium]|nr:diadenylate cyclase CdaA [Acidobacteriota bacterium]
MSIGEFIITWRDVVDVSLVAIIIYNLLLIIRGTRAVQVLIGLLFVGGIYFAAHFTQLATLETMLKSLLFFLPFAVIVLFQQEIRRGLAAFGRNPLWTFGSHQKIESTIHELVLAASALSARRIGALVVIQRLEGLRAHVENGILLDARISYDLLVNIFSPGTPLHDGAVIVQQDRIAAAACFLPLSLDPGLSTELGTRHRAAVGISTDSDAVAVVVSEETGKISLAIGGHLFRDLDSKGLRNSLYKHLITEAGSERQEPA